MKIFTFTIARVLYALPFAIFGLFHFLNAETVAAQVPLPGGMVWAYVTGALLLAGSVGILTRAFGSWAAFGLAALLAIFILFIHVPNLVNPVTQRMVMAHLLKDISLTGAALTWAGILREDERRQSRASRPTKPIEAH